MASPSSGTRHGTRALRVVGAYHRHALDPVDRFSEVIFGLIMVLAFTCSMSVAEGGAPDVHAVLVAALACNVAWGVVDGVMYVLSSIAERARRATVIEGIRRADPATARQLVLSALPEALEPIADDAAVDRIVTRFRALPEVGRPPALSREDLRGAGLSAVLVMLATLPPIIPFLLVADGRLALRISNGLAVLTLFLAGYRLGRATGVRAWAVGLAMVLIGGGLVALTVALGG